MMGYDRSSHLLGVHVGFISSPRRLTNLARDIAGWLPLYHVSILKTDHRPLQLCPPRPRARRSRPGMFLFFKKKIRLDSERGELC